MVSKVQQKIQFAAARGCFVYYDWWTEKDGKINWRVYIEGEHEPRPHMTKRAAKNLAYAVAVSKHIKLEVTFGKEW